MIDTTQEERRESVLTLTDVESLLGVHADTLRTYVSKGELPRPRQIGRVLFWVRSEIEAYLAAAPVAVKWPGPGEETVQEEAEAA